jgi:hydroxymethylpyrimidine pyrophosphatase-like HAD family hydrolase
MANTSDVRALGSLGDCSVKESPFSESDRELPRREQLASEVSFYGTYPWCVNACPTIQEVVEHLRLELSRLEKVDEAWQRTEVMTNVFLLSCAITDTVDDYLIGERYDFSQMKTVFPLVGPVIRALEGLLNVSRKVHEWRHRHVREWRENWGVGVARFLRVLVAAEQPSRNALSDAQAALAGLLSAPFPADLLNRRPRIPAAFRTQDLTHFDILSLGRTFMAAFPARQRPIVVVGLRTAGSYFAPFLHAYLAAQGYEDVESMTIRPKKGIARWEAARLSRGAQRDGLAVLVDEPPGSGATLAKALDVIRKAGFAASNVVALLPVHPTRRNWMSGDQFLSLSGISILCLEPEHWHKHRLLEPKAVERRLQEYFQRRKYLSVSLVASTAAERFNTQLQHSSEEKYHSRLKRVYEVRLQNDAGQTETRYVLAKSVGWGWLGYHAFLTAYRLSEFVPPFLGLRDGILYTEWLPQSTPVASDGDRDQVIRRAASYVASRVRFMGLGRDPSAELSRADQHKGFRLLAEALSGAYGWKAAAVLKRGRIQHELSRHTCPFPTLIDGKMRRQEWITGASALLKTDFEQHGLGKTELNMTDPAYDLAELMLSFGLSHGEESRLIARYVEECGDATVEERLFFNKLLAGRWSMVTALDNLFDPRLAHRHQVFNQQYVDALNFLTVHTMRLCASFCPRPETVRWHAPLVVTDIDGVLDLQIFGFPSTTAAGIRAVSLLHAHDVAVVMNTARTLSEVKEYCSAYGFVGGVAEYGGVIWDAVGGQERVLVSAESLDQLEKVRNALRQIPGVFLNDDYRYSIRAYTYERGRTVPLPKILIQNLMASLKADHLKFLQTYVDTAIVPEKVDKGTGLLALLALAEQRDTETIAIGDSEADLAMFRVTSRSFAPSNISVRAAARLLGCRIADRPNQRGLLRIVQSIVHPEGGRCDRCRAADRTFPEDNGLFWGLLEAADRTRPHLLLRAMLDPMALQAFAK